MGPSESLTPLQKRKTIPESPPAHKRGRSREMDKNFLSDHPFQTPSTWAPGSGRWKKKEREKQSEKRAEQMDHYYSHPEFLSVLWSVVFAIGRLSVNLFSFAQTFFLPPPHSHFRKTLCALASFAGCVGRKSSRQDPGSGESFLVSGDAFSHFPSQRIYQAQSIKLRWA